MEIPLMKCKPVKQPTIRIAMLEYDQLRLVGLRSLLDPVHAFELTAMSLSAILEAEDVNLALLGNHSGLKFFDTMASLASLKPKLRVIVTGAGIEEEAIFKIIAAGAKGYVQEAASAQELARAIYAVHGGSI